jgi:hypothetical protein
MKSHDIYVAEKKLVSPNSVLDLPLNPPEPCFSTSSAYSALVAEVTAGLPVSEARHHKGLTYISRVQNRKRCIQCTVFLYSLYLYGNLIC